MYDIIELTRMYKTVDMMISAHSRLRDKYKFFNLVYSSIVIILSCVSVLFVFARESLLNMHILIFPLKNLIIFLSISTFILSVLEIKLGWQAKENSHTDAVNNYFSLKCKISDVKNNINEINYINVRTEYEQICKYNIPLPDEQFLKLKRYHYIKVLTSRYLSKYKGAFIWLIKLKIIIKDNLKCIKTKNLT